MYAILLMCHICSFFKQHISVAAFISLTAIYISIFQITDLS